MARYYCSDDDITDRLSGLTSSQIATAAQRTTKLRVPARAWVNSRYPGWAPFPTLSTNDADGWQVNQTDHGAGDTTVALDGGTGNPAEDDEFMGPDDARVYTVTAYSGGSLTYDPDADEAWADDAPVMIGTPPLIREAAYWYALSIAYQILRNNPEDEAAQAAEERAMRLLGVRFDSEGVGGLATIKPWTHHPFQTATTRVKLG